MKTSKIISVLVGVILALGLFLGTTAGAQENFSSGDFGYAGSYHRHCHWNPYTGHWVCRYYPSAQETGADAETITETDVNGTGDEVTVEETTVVETAEGFVKTNNEADDVNTRDLSR